MPEETQVGLGDSTFRGRLRQPEGQTQSFASSSKRQPVPYVSDIRHVPKLLHKQSVHSVSQMSNQLIQEVKPHRRVTVPSQRPIPKVLPRPMVDVYKPQTTVVTRPIMQRPSTTPHRPEERPIRQVIETTQRPPQRPMVHSVTRKSDEAGIAQPESASPVTRRSRLKRLTAIVHRYSGPQILLLAMACCVFAVGIIASIQTLLTNKATTAQVAALSKKADKESGGSGQSSGSTPSTTKPSDQAIGQYAVAPDLPRYIKIPKLSVNARVLQVGVTTSGALGTPNNVYDAAWYTGSAKPGQPGATLIDGHVSSWTTHGAFYGIKNLVAGDTIQIVRGDGVVLNYKVVKTQTYDAEKVDMQAAVTTITAGKSGLNLITCGGKVKPGTNEFDKRVIVFAEQS